MIDPFWSVVDLDPVTWRNLGRFFDPGQYIRAAKPGEHGLFILHLDGQVLRVVDTERGLRRDLPIIQADQPRQLAEQLFASGEWARVHVINKRHLAGVARQAQESPRRDLTLDQYYHLVYRLVWDDSDGYVCVPPKAPAWNGWTYAGIQHFVSQLPSAATLMLGVLDENEVAIGLLLELREGLIRRVTTFEALDLPPQAMRLSPEFLDQLWMQTGAQFAPAAGALLCTPAAFAGWLAAEDKAAFLEQASREGSLVWRLNLNPASE